MNEDNRTIDEIIANIEAKRQYYQRADAFFAGTVIGFIIGVATISIVWMTHS